jgi:hypothetical protein
MVVIHKPWACLGNNKDEKTVLLYFDSMKRSKPLASCKQFATVILELDAARNHANDLQTVDLALVDRIASSLVFMIVDVSGLSIASIIALL